MIEGVIRVTTAESGTIFLRIRHHGVGRPTASEVMPEPPTMVGVHPALSSGCGADASTRAAGHTNPTVTVSTLASQRTQERADSGRTYPASADGKDPQPSVPHRRRRLAHQARRPGG